jgi:hypothetical protein
MPRIGAPPLRRFQILPLRNAQHHIMRCMPLRLQEPRRVRRHDRHVQLPRQRQQPRLARRLHRVARPRNLDEQPVPEQLQQPPRQGRSFLLLPLGQQPGQRAIRPARQRHQPLGPPTKPVQLTLALHVRRRHQGQQILPPGLVLNQQHQMIDRRPAPRPQSPCRHGPHNRQHRPRGSAEPQTSMQAFEKAIAANRLPRSAKATAGNPRRAHISAKAFTSIVDSNIEKLD